MDKPNQHTRHYRAVWVSDIHLGFRGCQAEMLLDFLHSIEPEYLFLVGDIVDCWSLRKSFYWPQQHTNVIRHIMGMAKRGTKVIYIPGNHDELMRQYTGNVFGNIEIHEEYIHETVQDKKLLILHGDEFDAIVKHSKFLAKLGSWAYDTLLYWNIHLNRVRSMFKRPHWSLAGYIKRRVKNAVNYIGSFEDALAFLAEERNVDGVVCGHIHHAELRQIDDILYCNDGDWVESCSALVEHTDGELELLYWAREKELVDLDSDISASDRQAA